MFTKKNIWIIMKVPKINGLIVSLPVRTPMSWLCKKYYHTSLKRLKKRIQFQPVSDFYTNPIDRLQVLSRSPLVAESDKVFNPSKSEMQEASLMFERMNVKGQRFEFLGSWPNPHIMPQWEEPEVAFIGKSNVGKSSLLAAMFAQIPEITVKVSSKPGHTKLMNVFRVGGLFNLVDMPGYGFNMPEYFETSVEAYIKSRRNLSRVFFLIDGAAGPASEDEIGVEMMEENSTPYVIVLTKIDKAHPSKLMRNVMSVMEFKEETNANNCFPQPFLVSSMNGEGLAYLQSFIAYITGNLSIEALS